MILDPEAVGGSARVLVDLRLEGGDAPGQVICGGVAMVVSDVLAQPAPHRLHRRPCCTDQGCGRSCPCPVCDQAVRTEIGRPNSSMRLSAWTAMRTLVARRGSVRERSPSPTPCLNRPMVASARARMVWPDASCQAAQPCLVMSGEPPGSTNCKWRSRCVGAVSAVSPGTAVECDDIMMVAAG